MLPATYQLPAAVVLMAGGLLACFAGYRLFRLVLSVYGFILGALLASSLMAPGEYVQMVIAAVIGGVLGAVLLNLAYFIGVALIGAGAGALILHLIWTHAAHGDPPVLLVVVATVIGAIVATQLQRYVIVLATAFGGAWTVAVGALAALGNQAARPAASAGDVWVAYPLSASKPWVVPAWLALSVLGVIVQLKTGAGPARKPRIVRRRK
jgi:hypothetical protein